MRDWQAEKSTEGFRVPLGVLPCVLFALLLLGVLKPSEATWAQTPAPVTSPAPDSANPGSPCGEGEGVPCPPADASETGSTPPDTTGSRETSAPGVPGTAPAPSAGSKDGRPKPPPGTPTPPGANSADTAGQESTNSGAPAVMGVENPANPDLPPVEPGASNPENPDNPTLAGPQLDFIRGDGETLGWGNDFRSWQQVTGYQYSAAHGNRVVLTYVQPAAAAKIFLHNAEQARLRQTRNFKPYPPGTMIALESWLRSDTGAPGKPGPLFFMQKENGFDPSAGDWKYGFTRRDMTVIGLGNSGTMAFCKECHGGAQSRDYIWATR